MNFEQIKIETCGEHGDHWRAVYLADNGVAHPDKDGIGVFRLQQDRPDPSKETCSVLVWTLWQIMASDRAARNNETDWTA